MPKQRGILLGQSGCRCNMLLWNDKKMNRRLGVDIIKCQKRVIFVQLVGRDFTRRNLAKQTVLHGVYLLANQFRCGPAPSTRETANKSH